MIVIKDKKTKLKKKDKKQKNEYYRNHKKNSRNRLKAKLDMLIRKKYMYLSLLIILIFQKTDHFMPAAHLYYYY